MAISIVIEITEFLSSYIPDIMTEIINWLHLIENPLNIWQVKYVRL